MKFSSSNVIFYYYVEVRFFLKELIFKSLTKFNFFLEVVQIKYAFILNSWYLIDSLKLNKVEILFYLNILAILRFIYSK